MNEMVKINVNGIEIQADNNKLLIEACEDSGIHIPRFCWHKRLDPVGMCRMCLVEVDTPRGKALVPSCTTKVTPNLVVDTESEVVKKAQEGVLEFLLINHPLDCPICDKAGECPLQDQTVSYGPGESRFVEEKRHFEKPISISEIILLDRERCILCARCTRFSDEISGDPLIEFVQRGNKTEVNTFPNEPFRSYFSGNTVQICPVGALTSTSYRFKARPWDLKATTSTCNGCTVGCTVELNASQNKMLRILGVDNDSVNQGWLCDKGRYNFEFLNNQSRLKESLEKVNEKFEIISNKDLINKLKNKILNNEKKVKFLLGTNLTNEEYAAFNEFSALISKSKSDFYLSDDYLFNGYFEKNISLATFNNLDTADTIVIWSEDIKENLPILYLRVRQAVKNGTKLIILGHNNSTLKDIASDFYSSDIIDENFELKVQPENLKNLKDAVIGKNVTAIIGKSSPYQNKKSLDQLVSFLNENSNLSLLNSFSKGNSFGAFQNLDSVKGLPDLCKDFEEDLPEVLFIVGADPIGSSVLTNKITSILEKINCIVSLDLFIHQTNELANYVVPMNSTVSEKEGTFTNIEFRSSKINKITPSPGKALSENEFLSNLLSSLGKSTDFLSVHELNTKVAENNFNQVNKITFDELDKPSNFDGIISGKEVNINCTFFIEDKSLYYVGRKLYGDSVTQRNSQSISILGSKKYIQANLSTIKTLDLEAGKCYIEQNGLKLSSELIINENIPDGLIYFPINRRNFVKYNFAEKINISNISNEEILSVQ